MATRLVLEGSPTELRYCRLDEERKSQCKIKEKYGKYIVTNKKGNGLYMANSKIEAEEYFWVDKPLKSVWPVLREPIEFKGPVKLGDVYKIIQARPELRMLAEMWWPNYRNASTEETSNDRLVVCRHAIIDHNDILQVENELEIEPSLAISELPLEINDSFIIKKKVVNKKNPDITTKQIAEGKYPFTLLDLLSTLFDNYIFYSPTVLTKNGLYSEKSLVDDPMQFLMTECKLEKMTLGDLFAWVDKHDILKVFMSMYSWCSDITERHKEAKKPTIKKKQIKLLEIYKSLGFDSCAITTGFYGRASLSDPTCYALDLSPMNSIANIPLKLDTEIPIETKEGTIKCNHPFTLLEILDSVYWEISHFGTLANVEKTRLELAKKFDDIVRSFGG